MERVEGGRAVVRVDRTACGKCRACGMLSDNRREEVEFEVLNRLGAAPGDLVTLRIAAGRVFRAYLWVFGLPVAAMVLGYLLGAWATSPLLGAGAEGAGVAAALAAGVLSFLGCLRLTNRMDLDPRMQAFAEGPAAPSGETP